MRLFSVLQNLKAHSRLFDAKINKDQQCLGLNFKPGLRERIDQTDLVDLRNFLVTRMVFESLWTAQRGEKYVDG